MNYREQQKQFYRDTLVRIWNGSWPQDTKDLMAFTPPKLKASDPWDIQREVYRHHAEKISLDTLSALNENDENN